MAHNLDNILIRSSQPDFNQKIIELRKLIVDATMFLMDDERAQQLENIVWDVNKNKDKAVAKYTEMFDGVSLSPDQFRIAEDQLRHAHQEIVRENSELMGSLRQAITNVRKYQQEIFTGRDVQGKIRYKPIQRVGICVPGASAPLPSTVIMTAVPAQVAGVKEIAVVSPPRYKGTIHPVILAVCHELGLTEVYRIGGAQAVAAMASGTQTIEKVYKIVGPGNQWVQMAKRMVFGTVGIDSVAGPSEVLIIANEKANPAWVAADMLSQAEHAPGSAMLFTDSQSLGENVLAELEKQVDELVRSEETIQCLKTFSKIAVFGDMHQVIKAANDIAAEHLEVQCGGESRAIAKQIWDAGAIFIGDYTPVAVGDYWAGPSHTLPTGSCAKFFSALTSNDFVKSTSIIEYDKNKLAKSAADIIRLAEIEGLDAHARSIKIRQQD